MNRIFIFFIFTLFGCETLPKKQLNARCRIECYEKGNEEKEFTANKTSMYN